MIPNDVIAEKAVLGASLINEDDCADVVENLKEEDFYDSKNQRIFKAIKDVFINKQIPNLVTMHTYLIKHKFDIPVYVLTELMETVPVNRSIQDFIRILKKVSYERKVYCLAERFKDGAIDFEKLTSGILELPSLEEKPDDETLKELFQHTLKASSEGVSYKFGMETLNKYLGGVDKGETIVIGGYTSQGKTMMGIQLAIDFAEQGLNVLYCTSEMTPVETARRILSNQTSTNIMDFRKGNLNQYQRTRIQQAGQTLGENWNITIKTVTYTSDISKHIKKYNPDIVFVDHLQNLDRIGNYSDYQRTTYNMRDLQNLALGTKKVVFVLSQLKRRKEDGETPPPKLSDLRDSGAIEEKSNMVLFVYWKKRLQDEVVPRYGGEEPEELNLIISKNRDGVIGKIRLDFYPEWCQIKSRDITPERRTLYDD